LIVDDFGVVDGLLINMMWVCNGNVVIKYDGRRPGLPNASVVMEHDRTPIEQRNLQPYL